MLFAVEGVEPLASLVREHWLYDGEAVQSGQPARLCSQPATLNAISFLQPSYGRLNGWTGYERVRLVPNEELCGIWRCFEALLSLLWLKHRSLWAYPTVSLALWQWLW